MGEAGRKQADGAARARRLRGRRITTTEPAVAPWGTGSMRPVHQYAHNRGRLQAAARTREVAAAPARSRAGPPRVATGGHGPSRTSRDFHRPCPYPPDSTCPPTEPIDCVAMGRDGSPCAAMRRLPAAPLLPTVIGWLNP